MSASEVLPEHDPEDERDALIAALCHDMRQYAAVGLALTGSRDLDALDSEDLRVRFDAIANLFEEIQEAIEETEGQRARSAPVDLCRVARDCVADTKLVSTVPIDTVLRGRVEALANASLLRRATLNMLNNATRAAGVGGRVRVEVGRRGVHAWLEVSDDGAGFGRIAAVHGLGMAVVDAAVRSAGGRLEINSGPDRGTRVRLWLPRPLPASVRP
jgi:signal transduction histidine kinase